jgi:hypothetical protein
MAFFVGPNNVFCPYPPPDYDIKPIQPYQKIVADTIGELHLLIKEIGAAVNDEELSVEACFEQRIKTINAYQAFLTRLEDTVGHLQPEQIIDLFRKAVKIIGERLNLPEYQCVSILLIFELTNSFTKIGIYHGTSGAKIDLRFLLNIKDIFNAYWGGERFMAWRDEVTKFIVNRARIFDCPYYKLIEYVSSMIFLGHIFSNEIENESFDSRLQRLSKEIRFDFLRELFGFETCYKFFDDTMETDIVGILLDSDVEIICYYLQQGKVSLEKISKILSLATEKWVISAEAWGLLLQCSLERFKSQENIPFLELWFLMVFYIQLKNKVNIPAEVHLEFLSLFQKNISLYFVPKNEVITVCSKLTDAVKLGEDIQECLLLSHDLVQDIEKQSMAGILVGVLLYSSLNSKTILSILQKLGPLLCLETRSEAVDSYLLFLVIHLIRKCRIEKQIEVTQLISGLGSLSLFENSDFESLAKHCKIPLFTERLEKISGKEKFQLVKELFGYELGFKYFYLLMSNEFDDISDGDVEKMGKSLELSPIPIGQMAQIFSSGLVSWKLSAENWSFLLTCLLNKCRTQESLLFLDVWHVITFYQKIRSTISRDESYEVTCLEIFEKPIRMILKNKSCVNELQPDTVEKNADDFLLLWDHLKTDIQKQHLAGTLIGVMIVQLFTLNYEHGLVLLEKLSVKIKGIQRSSEVDSFLLMLVIELVSKFRAEKSREVETLMVRLSCLNLFKHANYSRLFKHWDATHKDFMILCDIPTYLIDKMSLILGIKPSELVLHLFLQSKDMDYITKIRKWILEKTTLPIEPNPAEQNCMKELMSSSRYSERQKIDFFKFFSCIYIFPLELENNLILQFLNFAKRALPSKTDMEFCSEDSGDFVQVTNSHIELVRVNARVGELRPKRRVYHSLDFDYIAYLNILSFLNRKSFGLDRTFWNANKPLIKQFLTTRFTFENTNFINALNNKAQVEKYFDEFDAVIKEFSNLIGDDARELVHIAYLHWICACTELCKILKKNAQHAALSVRDFSFTTEPLREEFFKKKRMLFALVLKACAQMSEADQKVLPEIQKCLLSLNRPFFHATYLEEPKLVLRGRRNLLGSYSVFLV